MNPSDVKELLEQYEKYAKADTAPVYIVPSILADLCNSWLKQREALEFISGGCLVPPDGGSPNFDDAINAATEALQSDEEK